jgi:DNA-binding beta-propeller fold protein YncE
LQPASLRYVSLSALLWAFFAPLAQAQNSATFGEVIPLGSTPSDIVLDESRQRLYLVNTPASRVDVYDYTAKTLIGSIIVGQGPLAAAMSMDNAFLYVTNHDAASLGVISLNSTGLGSLVSTVSLPAKPQGVEVGADGRVLISTDGSGTSSTANTLLLFDGNQISGSQLLGVPFPPAPPTPPALQPPANVRLTTQFNGRLKRTPDGNFIVGVSSITNNTSTVVYVYETVSGTVLQSRTVTGQSSTLAMSPDGATFMAGFTLYDITTLNVLGQQSTANAPFAMTGTFATNFNVGGSVFSPDGSTLYSAFNTAALTTPPPAPQAATLLISDPRSLGIRLGINLPESILSRMVISSDGGDAWALSSSGVTHLPLSTLSNYPILMPESTTVFLRQDDCNPGIASATLRINNIGGGTLTFAVPSAISGGSAALIVRATSGLAPATVTFTMDPGRSGVIRTPGTNLYTGAGSTNTGSAVNIQLVSPNAINVPPTIRVYMNYRDSSMRGVIYAIPTVPNSSAAAYEGLQDIVLDENRNRVYITNSGYNRIEVFNTFSMAFEAPIPVGQLPHQMAMGLDGTTLYVANTGSETVSLVDLDQQLAIGAITFPPIPRAGNAAVVFVRGMATGLSGLQIVRSDGSLWTVVANTAIPRTPTTITGITAAGAQTAISGPTQSMLASDDGTHLILLGGNGTAYLYDGLADAYTASRQLFTAPIIGYYGPLGVADNGNFLLANGLVLNRSLTAIGGAASPGQITITPPPAPGQPFTVGVTSSGLRNVAAVAPVGDATFLRMSTAVRNSLTTTTNDDIHTIIEAVDTRTGATATAARPPENPVLPEFGTARTAMTARQMVVDSGGTVYAFTVSGLSVVPLTPATSATQPQLPSSGAMVNANDGTSSFAPGAFININGSNLASTAAASTLPPPTVLGGSCVLIDEVAIPLLTTSPSQISAQLPNTVRAGINVLQVRSLANAQQSNRVVITVQKP